MNLYRPGGFDITGQALEACHLEKGSRVLDIGCGEGETAAWLAKEHGLEVVGIDSSLEAIRKSKELHPELDFRYGDGEFLEDFTSKSFDCVMMECVLSLINLPDEALHEAFCVLKKGGKLVISDLYIQNPEPGLVKALDIEAKRVASTPHEHGECSDDCSEDHKHRVVKFRSEGRFLKEPLLQELKELGYNLLLWEDKSKELVEFVAEKIMAGEELDTYFCGKGDCVAKKKGTGYFLLVAEKPL